MRHRIDHAIRGREGARIIALDRGSRSIVEQVSRHGWGGARFFYVTERPGQPDIVVGDCVPLCTLRGSPADLRDELSSADVVVMVATGRAESRVVAQIGAACTVRAIVTAGLVIGERAQTSGAVSALRPHARVIMTSQDERDVIEVLTALRA
ncbi:MAG: 3-methyl-2-oxobutanoate hydroxymethyltransferase [Mycobacterium sp.]